MNRIAAIGLVLLVAACGKAPESAAPLSPASEAAPSSMAVPADEPEPQTLAEAEALLDKARSDLDQLALNDDAPGAVGQASGAAPSPAPVAPPAASRAEEKRADKAAADEGAPSAPKKEATTCETACKAFSSLERASDAVCRLDTEIGGKRCERAKQIRQDAARRVTSCSCNR